MLWSRAQLGEIDNKTKTYYYFYLKNDQILQKLRGFSADIASAPVFGIKSDLKRIKNSKNMIYQAVNC